MSHALDLRLPSPLDELADERTGGVRVLLKRDDLIHPDFPGNKWRKLKYNLPAAGTVLTFGGAWSNHILATAAAGHHFGFGTVGVIRGEEHHPLNPVLARAAGFGMRLAYVDRTTYRSRAEPAFLGRLRDRFGDFHLIPEGGANAAALRGTAELVDEIESPFDVLACACGTGATLAGAATALAPGRRAVGFPVLRGGDYLTGEIRRLQREYGVPTANWSLEPDFHFGGFARRTPVLEGFVSDFHARHGVALDPVYEGKMMSGLLTLIGRGVFRPGTTVVALLA
ncbi:1-aminocyclopropane-1-carboxylate deaminase/D-cysteine desulfhydrase [Paractinoplanes rishiriensis]|nr:pyridoxal-phosphate dependent enzyme [Actinoplanes rishiriensis]